MNAVETVQAECAAIEAGDWERARSLLANDYTFSGAVPEPIGPDAWLGIHRGISEGLPDFSFNLSGARESGDKVFAQVRITGTQTRTLALPIPGLKPIPATGKHVSHPIEDIVVTVHDGKITNWEVSEVAGGGVPGLLAQVGATIPAHQ